MSGRSKPLRALRKKKELSRGKLSSIAGESVRVQVRAAVTRLVEEQKIPLSLVEKESVIEEILDRVFGLGPLEPLRADRSVSDILVTTLRAIGIRPKFYDGLKTCGITLAPQLFQTVVEIS